MHCARTNCTHTHVLLHVLPLLALVTGAHALRTMVVTHAGGRMGVSVVGQLRERWVREQSLLPQGEQEELRIRAVVRTDAEASRLRLDLCGAICATAR